MKKVCTDKTAPLCYAGNVKEGGKARRRAPFSAEALRSMREAARGREGRLFHTIWRRAFERVCTRFLSLERMAPHSCLYRGPGSWPMREVWAPRRDCPPQRALDAGEHQHAGDRAR
nr:MAG TPA: hypothetical protein [Caudoviricetes sp.]